VQRLPSIRFEDHFKQQRSYPRGEAPPLRGPLPEDDDDAERVGPGDEVRAGSMLWPGGKTAHTTGPTPHLGSMGVPVNKGGLLPAPPVSG
jgi:hypothetical protein